MQLRELLLHKLFLLELLSVTLLSSCSLFSSERNIFNITKLPKIVNQFAPSIAWNISVGDGVGDFYSNLHPAYADGVVYAADRKGIVKAININSGKKVWSVNLAEKSGWLSHATALLSGGISVFSKRIYIGSEKAQVYALNTDDGTIAWQTNVAGEALSSPVVDHGIVLVHTGNGQLQALNEIDGVIKWTINLSVPLLSLRGESTPVITLDAIIIGGDNGCVSAILIQYGQIIWRQCISQITGATEIDHLRDVDITPVILNNIVYASAYNGNLTALDLHSGQIIWKRKLSSINDFIIDNGRIYLVDQNNCLLSLNAKDGLIIWTQGYPLHHRLTPPVLYDGNLVVGDSEGYMQWIDPKNGHLLARQKIDNSGFLTKPIVADSKLIIQAKNGILYAFID